MTNIYAGIVLYNPDIERLKQNIESIINQVQKVVLVDNGSENNQQLTSLIDGYSKTYLIVNNDNLGIARALNQIFEYAITEKIDWVLTLDQDSICPAEMISKFSQSISDKVGMICPKLDILGWNLEKSNDKPVAIEEVNDCITSGALTSIVAWKAVNGFNEEYFIDLVDSEYSLKLKVNGYKILRNNDVIMQHEVGESVEKRFLGHVLRCTKHSPVRCYYMVRNHLFYIKRYKEHLNMRFERKMLFHKIVTSILVADEKIKTIRMIIKGILAYKKGIVGKY